LSYAVRELEKDVSEQAKKSGRTAETKTQFGIFVLHNKEKPKKGTLPTEITQDRYWAAETIPDLWVFSHCCT
jgi:hypoxanthine phosphoribosyltransferase